MVKVLNIYKEKSSEIGVYLFHEINFRKNKLKLKIKNYETEKVKVLPHWNMYINGYEKLYSISTHFN